MMVLLQLPLFSNEDSVRNAFGIITEKHAPAAVVKFSNDWILFPSRVIFLAYKDNRGTFNELSLSNGYRLLRLDEREIGPLPAKSNSSFANPGLESLMKGSGTYFAVFTSRLNEIQGMVNVVSRRGIINRVLPGSNMICVCTGVNKHLRDVEDGTDLTGKACTVCGFPYVCTVSL